MHLLNSYYSLWWCISVILVLFLPTDCWYVDQDSPGNDVAGPIASTGSEIDCQTLCKEDVGCNFFSWESSSQNCWLKSSGDNLLPKAGHISGPKYCPGEGKSPCSQVFVVWIYQKSCCQLPSSADILLCLFYFTADEPTTVTTTPEPTEPPDCKHKPA